MRLLPIAAAVAISATAAQAQQSDWAYFEDPNTGLLTAGTVSEDGMQLILKCDEAGDGSVFAAIVTGEDLAEPQQRPPVHPVFMIFDDGPPREYRWYFYPDTALAPNTRRDPLLEPFLERLADASTLNVRLVPHRRPPVHADFVVAGAREAAARVFESCEDENPLE